MSRTRVLKSAFLYHLWYSIGGLATSDTFFFKKERKFAKSTSIFRLTVLYLMQSEKNAPGFSEFI